MLPVIYSSPTRATYVSKNSCTTQNINALIGQDVDLDSRWTRWYGYRLHPCKYFFYFTNPAGTEDFSGVKLVYVNISYKLFAIHIPNLSQIRSVVVAWLRHPNSHNIYDEIIKLSFSKYFERDTVVHCL